ncbi:hypothetical protein ACG2DA_21640, partial [Alienimonas sp. DA493]
MRTDLWDDPRVADLCVALDEPEHAVCGGLFRLWSLADAHTTDGVLQVSSAAALDRKIGVRGFTEAVASVGWLDLADGEIRIVRFEDHNGKSAKRRADDAKRQANRRAKLDDSRQSVRGSSAKRHAPPVTDRGRKVDLEPEPEPEPEPE